MTFEEAEQLVREHWVMLPWMGNEVEIDREELLEVQEALSAELDRQREARSTIKHYRDSCLEQQQTLPGESYNHWRLGGMVYAYGYALGFFSEIGNKSSPTYEHDPHFWRR